MRTRTLAVMVVVFIALVAAATASWWWPGGDSTPKGTSTLGLTEYTENNTTSIVISKKGEKKKVVAKSGSAWKINGHTASLKEVRGFFDVLGNTEPGDMVSNNAAHHADFGVTEGGGYTLSLTRNGDTTTYYVGNTGDTPTSFYVARAGDARVYMVSGSLPGRLAQNESMWQKQ